MKPNRYSLPFVLFFMGPTSLSAQVPNISSGQPPETRATDLEEVEDEANQDDILPAYSGSLDATLKEAEILSQQVQELSLSHFEIRRSFDYGSSLGIGETIPWQNYSVEFYVLDQNAESWGLAMGTGGFHDEGRVQDRHFDIDFSTRSTAVTRRYFADVLQPASLGLVAGIAMFDGKIDPSGSDDLLSDQDEKLQSTFRATAGFIGVSVGVTALWYEGWFIEWTPVGLRQTFLFSTDFSRESEAAKKAVDQSLEHVGIYGLVNFKLGKFF